MAVSNYGLSAQGFKRKRLPEIIQSLNDRVEDKLGIKIQTGANSLFGQIHGVYAFELANLWEVAEQNYYAMYPNTAQGTQLENSAALAGIPPIGAEQTSVYCACYGTEGTVVPFGALISDGNNLVFSCNEGEEKISANRACDVTIAAAVSAGATYTLILDGVPFSYTATATDTANSILSALAAGFSFTDRTLTLGNDGLQITMNDQSTTLSIIVSGGLSIVKLGSPFEFLSETFGAVNPGLGTLNNIVTAYSGWTGVSNNVPANVGRDAETDTALRQRWSVSVYGRALGMTDAIAAALLQLAGVTAAKVYENTSDLTDSEGRPPHSIEAVVSGGDAADICGVIMRKKAAGIDTYGDISRDVMDSQGITHTVYYNTPQEVLVWLNVVVTTDDAEEEFGGLQNVKAALLAAGESYTVGQDVILQKFYGAVYRAVTGIGYITLTATTGTTPGTYSAANISIDPRHVAVFDESRITVSAD